MTTELRMLDVQNRQQWRTWLGKHYASSPGVWLVFYKKHMLVKSIPYEDSVREALCFGWIDSLIKRLDDDRYVFQGVHMMLEGNHQRKWQDGEARESRLVFIGRELPEQAIREGFESCIVS